MVGWIGEWLERLDYRYKYMGHTSQMERPASEYFERNIWINGDPEEKMFPLIVQFAGDEKFFVGSDYPHAEGFVEPVRKGARNLVFAAARVDRQNPGGERPSLLRDLTGQRCRLKRHGNHSFCMSRQHRIHRSSGRQIPSSRPLLAQSGMDAGEVGGIPYGRDA